jgi:Skp family chaperone for outer membrane proteins
MTRIAVVCAFSVLLGAGPALAQTPPPPVQTPPPATPPQAPPPAAPVPFPADSKVGFVNLQSVVEQSTLGKASSDRMRKFDADKQAELQTKAKELEGLRTKLAAQRELLSEAAAAALAKEIDFKTRQLQFDQEGANVEREQLQAELLADFNRKVIPLVEELRKQKGLWLVFSVADAGIIAAHAGLDLSGELVKMLDAVK